MGDKLQPYHQDNSITIYNKDCRSMDEIPDGTAQMCVTSPPYWGLRKYKGNQDLVWGNNGNSWRGAYGLEPTPELYVQHTIQILREVRRVLRKDGVVFLNLGDSYAANRSYQVTDNKWVDVGNTMASKVPYGLKPKDLCLIPFRVAIAAQEDGWWVRSVIIWSKNNPMPESVRDRPTESHEYILLLTKSSKYYWDMEAVREPQQLVSIERMKRNHFTNYDPNYPNQQPQKLHQNEPPLSDEETEQLGGRNLRSVWTFSTQPYKEAHFATFPEELPERCIKAGTPEYGCCDKCGMPYDRIVEHSRPDDYDPSVIDSNYADNCSKTGGASGTNRPLSKIFKDSLNSNIKTLGWKQACKCADSKPVSSIVLDPFTGSGTTLWVAKKLGRKAIGYELSEEYCQLALERNRQMALVDNG